MTKEQIHQAHLDILLVSENNVLTEAEKQTELTLSAMEEQAVKFIEWRENTPNVRRVGIDKWFYNGEYYTSKELYKLFNEL